MAACEVEKVDDYESSYLPKIVSFENGQLNNTSKLQCKSFYNPDKNKNLITVESDRLTYIGEESNIENDLFYTLLAIRNKKTNKVRIVPVNTVSLNVHMSKKNSLLDSTISNKLSIGDLYKQFGSKKNKRLTEQYEKMKMNVSHVEDELKNAVTDVKIKEEDLKTNVLTDSEVGYTPKMNREANNVEDVYDLYSIIKKDELKSLKSIAKSVIEKSVTDVQLSDFVLHCVNRLKQEGATDVKRFAILLYCDAILKFFKARFVKKMKIDPYPDIIVQKIIQEFTVFADNSRSRPHSMRDKGICHVIVLALIAMNFQVNLETLATSLKAAQKKVCDMARLLGAQPISSANKPFVRLKLPLPPLVIKQRKQKKK